VLTGANNVTVVVTDVDGRERAVNLPFYMNTQMLGRGITDFSFEAGAVREDFGLASGNYGQTFASGIWRRGLSDALTLELHGEVAKGLAMGGLSFGGAVRDLFAIGGSLAVSEGPDGGGTLWAIGFDRTTPRFSFIGRHEESSAGFRDIATLAGEPHTRKRDSVAVGLGMGKGGTLNLAYVSETRGDGVRTPVATASYAADLFDRRARLMVTGYGVLDQHDQWGVGVTLSVPLGRHGLATAGAHQRPEGRSYELEARGATMDNRLIWQVRDVEGPTPNRSAELRWDGATLDGQVRLRNDEITTTLQVEAAQSLVLFDGHLFVADRVDDAFAVVQVGRNPGVEVFRENQPVGRTDDRGRLFVNHLRAYESNGLSIDPAGLPLDAALETTSKTVAPRRGAGAPVTFKVVEERSALVTLMTKGGAAPPAGAEVRLGDRVFPMGYGGEVYLRGLEVGRNVIRVLWRERDCEVVVTVPDQPGEIIKLGPYACTP
jgi:outer membrane usher protein